MPLDPHTITFDTESPNLHLAFAAKLLSIFRMISSAH
jgi:hypothetical protein